MTRNFLLITLSLLVSLVSLLGLNGCEKPPFIQTVTETPYLGLPVGMNNILSLNIERLRNREGFEEFTNQMVKDAGKGKTLDEYIKSMNLGIDPLHDIDMIVIGERGNPNPNNPFINTVVIARGNFANPAPKLQQFNEWMAEQWLIAPPPFTETTHPGTDYKRFQTRAQSQYNEQLIVEVDVGFPSEQLMVVAFQTLMFNEALDIIAGKMNGLGADQAWLAMIGRANTGAMFWGTGNINTAGIQNLKSSMPMGAQTLGLAKQYYFDVDIVKEFVFDLGLVCSSIDDSEKLSTALKQGITQAKGLLQMFLPNAPQTLALLDRLVVLTELETIKINMTLTEDQRVALIDEWEELGKQMEQQGGGGMLPGALGGAIPGMPNMGGPR